MSHENVETTRRLFKAVEERDVAGVLPLMILRLSSAMLHHYLWAFITVWKGKTTC